MATTIPTTHTAQPPVGVPCALALDQLDAVITLLRVIERLPELSASADLPPERARRLLETIHRNHLHLAERARTLLSAETEDACRIADSCEAEPIPNRERNSPWNRPT